MKRGFPADGNVDGRKKIRDRQIFIDNSGVIGTKEFVARCAQRFKSHFGSKNEKRPKPIAGLEGVYSLKRLSEMI